MKEGQKAIYYIAGGDEDRLRKSPLLEMYRKQGIEVLVCAEEIDEIVLSGLGPFEGLELKSVNRAGSESELARGSTSGAEKPEAGSPAASAIDKAKKALGEAVKDVRLSKRLLESPACVVVDSDDPSLQLRELMKQLGGNEMPEVKPILELNGEHPLVSAWRPPPRRRPRTSPRSSWARPSSSRAPSSPIRPTSPQGLTSLLK